VPCCPIHDVPREFGVIEPIGIGGIVERRSETLEDVDVSEHDKVDVVLVEDLFEGFLTI
jgi:hypothetical protein